MTVSPIGYWLADAATVFINGCISSMGSAGLSSGGTGIVTTKTQLGEGLTPEHQLLIAGVSGALSVLGNGLKRVVVWHDSNPFPNPFPAPTNLPSP